jgi:uncharacterized protein DUF4150
MGDTVSNHDLAVVTKGTDHLATTQGATDVCFDAPKKVPAPYEHFVPSTQLGAGQTTKTMIVGQPIVTKVGVIEPPANGHAGVGGGVASGTYNDNAKPTGSSPDVKAEGNLVVRSTDTTTQNSANTTGAFTPPALNPTVQADKGNQLARCTIIKVDGVCAGSGEGHGRHLDFPPNAKREGDGYYLEVLSKDTVTLTGTRKNAIEAGGPVCPPTLHTQWVVDRSGGGEPGRKKTYDNRDVLELETAWFTVESLEIDSKLELTKKGDKNKDDIKADALKAVPVDAREKEVVDRRADGQTNIGASKRQYADQRAAQRAEANESITKEQERQKSNNATAKAVWGAAQTAVKLYQMWSYLQNPVTVQITALGCSGSKNITLKSFPPDKIEFDMFSEKVAENVARLKSMATVVEKVIKKFDSKFSYEFDFLVGPTLTLTIQYKELTRDGKGIVKSQCNRTWELAISFEKFLYISAEYSMPLLNFFGPMGGAANVFLNVMGVEGDAFFKVSLGVVPKMAGSWNEYNEWAIEGFSVEMKLKFEVGVKVKFGDWAEIKVTAYATFTVTAKDPECLKEYLIQFTIEGDLQLGIKGGATVNIWGWSKSYEFDYKPPDWKYSLPKGGKMSIVKL